MDLIASFLVRGINLVFHVMPMGFNLWVGRRFGAVFYLLSAKRRNITYANLKAAFYKEKTPEEIKRLSRKVYNNLAETFVEILSMTKVNKPYIEKYVKVHNIERIENASKNPKGMILLSAHFGNWELSTVTSVMKGFPLYLLARDQRMKRLNELLNTLRELKGNIVIRKGTDIKNIFRVLHKGKAVGILADQNAGASGELIELFERPASTAVGPYRFAQKSGAWILPAFIHRVKGKYHELVLEEPMMIKKGEEITPYLIEYNRLLEKHIRNFPEQWLWMHKKWKLTPVKKILVLDDGRKGHIKQSLASCELISRFRRDKGYKTEHTKIDIAGVKFKNKTAKVIFNILSLFFSSRCQGCLKCLKMAISPESYEDISHRYADIIVSAGTVLRGVNKLLKIENNAHNLTIMAYGFLHRKSFDIMIIPAHDIKKHALKASQVIVADLALTSISPSMEATGYKTGNARIIIGILFGGDSKYFTFDRELTRFVAKGIKDTCKKINADFYITTSRRTSYDSEEILKEELAKDAHCAGFVTGKNDQNNTTVEDILSMSDAVIVSGESISMVSEAVYGAKPVLVFMPDKKTRRYTKHERFIRGLSEKGYIDRIRLTDMSAEVERVLKEKKTRSLPNDNERIYEKIYKLL